MYFQQKSSEITIRNFSEYIVTEIEIFLDCLLWKGMSFTIFKLLNLGWYLSLWCQILRHFKAIPQIFL